MNEEKPESGRGRKHTGRSPHLIHEQGRMNARDDGAGSDCGMAHPQESELTKEASSGWGNVQRCPPSFFMEVGEASLHYPGLSKSGETAPTTCLEVAVLSGGCILELAEDTKKY